ncbi:MAG: thioesterase family protein [Rhabdaerophilum sp.]
MNLWFRVLWLFLTAPFRARIEPPFGVSRLHFRVWPNDIDTNLHMNNGRYLTIADLGRTDLLLQTGLWRAVLKEGLLPMLSGSAIRYRRELKPFQAFTLESRIVCWRATTFVMEHRFITSGPGGEHVTAALALVRGGLYARRERQFVPAERLVRLAGYAGDSPALDPEIEAFLAVEDGLKRR